MAHIDYSYRSLAKNRPYSKFSRILLDVKTAIVMVGGGMRSGHGAGFLYALGTKLGITHPDMIVASSGNACNSLYFATGQYEFLKEAWTRALSSPKFISFARPWRIMDIDYLVDGIFRQQLPLNVEALRATSIEYYVPLTDAETGKTVYLGKEQASDPFALLRAAAAIPIAFGKAEPVAGRLYIDGEVGPVLQDHINFAIARGATRILAIDNGTPRGKIYDLIIEGYERIAPVGIRHAFDRELSHSSVCLISDKASIMCVQPTTLPATTLTRDPHKLLATFNTGIQDALKLSLDLQNLFLSQPSPITIEIPVA